jgi:hypothetical protein
LQLVILGWCTIKLCDWQLNLHQPAF